MHSITYTTHSRKLVGSAPSEEEEPEHHQKEGNHQDQGQHDKHDQGKRPGGFKERGPHTEK